jgi:D-inositol-3-phosphate glycosyltransferase
VLYQGLFDRFFFSAKVRAAMRAESLGVLHAHHLRGLERAFVLLPRAARVVLTEHEFRASRVLHPWSRLALARVDAVHAISEPLAAANTPRLGVDPARVRVLVHGVDTARFAPAGIEARREAARARFGLGAGDFAVLLPGRICEAKNQAVLVEAAARLRDRAPGARILFAGEDKRFLGGAKAYYDALVARIGAAGLGGIVRFLGFVSPVEDVYAAADLVAIPSRHEAFGLVAVEAMAAGATVLAGRGGALPSIVEDGTSGVLLAPDDAEAWAGAIAGLAADPARRAALGRAAAAAVGARFSLARHDAGILDLYRGRA